jgi:NitT/TauT family transport system permease protein
MAPRLALIRTGLIAACVLLLEALCRTGIIPRNVMISPSAMADALWRLLISGDYADAIRATLGSVALAAVLAILIGAAFGIAIHGLPRLRAALDPLFASYYAVPTFLFYPVLIVFFGVGRGAIVATAVLMGCVAMTLATLAGLDRVPSVLLRTGRIMQMGRAAQVRLIVVPSAAPYMFSGAKLAVAYAFIGVIASEFIMSGEGLGYAIANAYNEFDNRTMYGLMLLIIVAVTVVNGVLHAWDQRLQQRLRR